MPCGSLPTGGRTPLAHALVLASETIRRAEGAGPALIPMPVLLTDGKANVGLPDRPGDPWEQALRAAGDLADAGVAALVLDTEDGFVRLGRGPRNCRCARRRASLARRPDRGVARPARPPTPRGGGAARRAIGIERTKDTLMARLIIAGTSSGVGKTTITVGLIAALRARGLSVQSFKVGPDYIDPTYHTLATGRPCRNLDAWMVPPDRVLASFRRATRDADVTVVEGVMGLYDGFGYDDEAGSTAAAAKLLNAPVVLVVDASKMARSAGAIALGYRRFDPELNLAGFIANRVGGDGHGRGVAAAIERATGLPVFGWLPRDARLAIPERYLGLVPTREPGQWTDFIHAAGEIVASHLDLDRILTVARQAPPLGEAGWPEIVDSPATHANGERPVIAVARDEAFHFTYPENLERLEAAGAEIAFFSPMRDHQLPPNTAGVMLSGGFPELYATDLSGNGPLHAALRDAHEVRMPIYAECGGLMYLTEAIVDGQGREHPMVGLLPGRSAMSGRLTLGYRLGRAARDSWLFKAGEAIRGHEFHYSSWIDRPAGLPAALELTGRDGDITDRLEGACTRNLWASYVHLHFDGLPELACRFVTACRSWRSSSTAAAREDRR